MLTKKIRDTYSEVNFENLLKLTMKNDIVFGSINRQFVY